MFRKAALLFLLPLFFYMLFFPKEAFTYSLAGLELWFHTVLPSLLPFMILSGFFIGTGKIERILGRFSRFFFVIFGVSPWGAYALLLGLFCGYPMGARLTADLYARQKISRAEACYLLTFSNNASPMFLSAYVAVQNLQSESLLPGILSAVYGADLLTGLFFRIRFGRFRRTLSEENVELKKEAPSVSWGELIDTSVMNGLEAAAKLGGYIILFSIFSGAISQLLTALPCLRLITAAITEVTTGVHTLAQSHLPFVILFPAVCSCTAFGGLSAAAQTKSMLNGTDLPIGLYLFAKCINSILAAVLALLFVLVGHGIIFGQF